MRRVILNDDANYSFAYELGDKFKQGGFSSEELFGARIGKVLGTQVDSVFWNVGHYSLKYPTKLKDFPVQNVYKPMIDGGLDPLELICRYCHKHSLEFFASYRMNDCHDVYISEEEVIPYKKAHPELLLGEGKASFAAEEQVFPSISLQFCYHLAFNYALEAVRNHIFSAIQEVCQNYELDGLELDFMRFPMFFKSNYNSHPATDEETEIMTGFLQRIRLLLDEVSTARGRPFLLGVNVPPTIETSRYVGLDIEQWLRDDLIDIVAPQSAYSPLSSSVEPFVKLAHQYNVPIYPRCVGGWAAMGSGLLALAWRAAAMAFWNQGVDGMYLFNLGDIEGYPAEALREIGDRKILARLDKCYGIEFNKLAKQFAHIGIPAELPLNLNNTKHVLHLVMGDDIQSASAEGKLLPPQLRLKISGALAKDKISFKLNGHALADGTLAEEWLTYIVEPSLLKMGVNELRVDNNSVNSGVLERVELWLRYSGQ